MTGPMETWVTRNDMRTASAVKARSLLLFAREQDAKLAKLEADNARRLAALELSAKHDFLIHRDDCPGDDPSCGRCVWVTGPTRDAIEEAKR